MTRAVRADDWEAYTGLQPGQTYADIPDHLQRYRTDIFTDKYKRLAWEELSRTITAHIAKDGYWYIHPEQHRTLSIREAARLQTFPDWFRFAGQPSHRYAQIGNAVPPLLGEAVGAALLESLSGRDGASSDMERRPTGAARMARAASQPTRGGGPVWTRGSCSPASSASSDPPRVTLSVRFKALSSLAPSASALLGQREPDDVTDGNRHERLMAHDSSSSAAQTLVELFDGDVPAEDLELRAIPGIGDSAAKTVLCFGHGRSARAAAHRSGPRRHPCRRG